MPSPKDPVRYRIWRENIAKGSRKFWSEHPELKREQTDRMLNLYKKDPSRKKRISAKFKELWKTPEYKNKMAERRPKSRVRRQGGYLKEQCPDHPRADEKGYVYQHILVAERSIGRSITIEEAVHHLNGNKYNNDPSNLVVLSRSDHSSHHLSEQHEKGLMPPKKPQFSESNPSAKLTWNQAQEIRKRYLSGGITFREIAKFYQVDHGTISAIVSGRTYVNPPN